MSTLNSSHQQNRPPGWRASVGEPTHTAKVSPPVAAQWTCNHLTIGGGVAIFHVASARVVLCYHTRAKYWFLPKGRRDVGETSEQGAEREGYEESGYRNRLLPLPLAHRQPSPGGTTTEAKGVRFVIEPVWTMMMPLSNVNQYLLFWYIAETVPPEVEETLNAQQAAASSGGHADRYQYPPKFPADVTLKQRLEQEPEDYEPVRHDGTGVDDDEAQYMSYLLPIDEAVGKLKDTVLSDVVRIGWQAIQLRQQIEDGTVAVEQSRGQLLVKDKTT